MALASGFIVVPGEGRGGKAAGWGGVAPGSSRAGVRFKATAVIEIIALVPILKKANCMPSVRN